MKPYLDPLARVRREGVRRADQHRPTHTPGRGVTWIVNRFTHPEPAPTG